MRFRSLAPYYLIPLIALATLPFAASDLSCWTALGLKTLASHSLQTIDSFSVFTTKPLIYPAWGVSILYALLFPYLGLAGLCLLHWLIPLVLLAWIYRRSLPRAIHTPQLRLRLAIYLVWLGLMPALGERPSALALLLVAATFDQVSRLRLNSSWTRIWPLIALQILWVNLHGSFVLLPVMLGWRLLALFGIRALRRSTTRLEPRRVLKAAAWLTTVSAAIFANPFGWKVLSYVWENAQVSAERGISEWERTAPLSDFPAGLLQYSLTAGIIALWLWKKKRDRRNFSSLASPFFPLLLLGFQAVRNTALPFLVLLPFLSLYFRSFLVAPGNDGKERLASVKPSMILTLAGVAAWVTLWPPFKPSLSALLPESRRPIFAPAEVPLNVLQAIRDSGLSNCPVFAEIELGGALMLQVPNPIFMDTRNIIYSDADFKFTQSILNAAPDWQTRLASKGPCFVVVDRSRHQNFAEALLKDPRWKLSLREEPVALFEHRD